MSMQGRIFVARHGETVFNASTRMQGQLNVHTPLTSRGFAQADAMGQALALWLGTRQSLHLWCSTAGRARQTMAIICEHLGADYHSVEFDDRLQEIDVGEWSGRNYAEIEAEIGPFVDRERGLFTQTPKGGESYGDVAARLRSWMADTQDQRGDRLVIMHGMSGRVLRGLQRGLAVDTQFGAPIAESLAQGSLSMIGYEAEEKLICAGEGAHHA